MTEEQVADETAHTSSDEPAGPAGPPPSPPVDEGAATPGAGYRVTLDAYAGPLDLLLYLIRKNEVDIHDIPVAHIAEQYQRHIELLAEINVNVAGEFLVMAATLMEIKSRMLIPREEGLEGEEEEDPRAELVRQLLEYKRYKDLARELGDRAAQQALKYKRPELAAPQVESDETDPEGNLGVALEGVGLWELIDAFSKVLSETSLGAPEGQVLERERPIQEYRQALLQTLQSEGALAFSEIFARCQSRDEMIAMFIALLELVRLHQLTVQQAGDFGELHVAVSEGKPAEPAAPPEPAPAQQAAQAVEPGRFKPVVKQADILDELEDEAETLGRSRERIDAAIRAAESFLKDHHQQAKPDEPGPPEEGAAEPPSPDDPAPPAPETTPPEDSTPDAQEGTGLDQRQ